jgi:hypothetical protein
MLFHSGQTQHVELGPGLNQANQDAAAEVRKANQQSSPRRIHSFSKDPRRHSILCYTDKTILF